MILYNQKEEKNLDFIPWKQSDCGIPGNKESRVPQRFLFWVLLHEDERTGGTLGYSV